MFLIILSICLFSTVLGDHGSESLTFSADSFDTEIAKTNNFVMFFAPWCGHCKRLAPTWDELGGSYNKDTDDNNIQIAKVDCTVDTGVCSKHGVTGYPTLKFFKKGSVEPVRYKGQRDIESLKTFVEEQLAMGDSEGEEKEATEEKKPVVIELTDKTFVDHVDMGNHFVKFYAPWCGHCKKLAPVWEQLAQSYAASDKPIQISKIDCTLHNSICKLHSVGGYPSLFFFKDGFKVDSYVGSRSLEDLKKYVDKMIKGDADELKKEPLKEKIPDGEPEPSPVLELDDETFDSAVADKVAFVKFYAPWCGHCKRLAPTWEEFALKNQASKLSSLIAKVDCTKHKTLCGKHQVRGYPTLLLFKNGKKITEYNGQRDLGSLQAFFDTHNETKDDDKREEL